MVSEQLRQLLLVDPEVALQITSRIERELHFVNSAEASPRRILDNALVHLNLSHDI